MGNDQSSHNEDNFQVPPVIKRLRNSLRLNIVQKRTSSFVSGNFAEQIKKTSGEISRVNNPFCALSIDDNSRDEINDPMICCLISPIMVIASPRFICNQESKKLRKAKISGLTKSKNQLHVRIKNIYVIKQNVLCILLLQNPVVQLGWAGLSFIQNEEHINNEPFRIINHSPCDLDAKNLPIYRQQISKAFYKLQQGFIGSYKTIPGSLIFKIMDKKPYIVGIQANQNEGHFFTKGIFQHIKQIACEIIDIKKQKEIIQRIDIQELQLMEKL